MQKNKSISDDLIFFCLINPLELLVKHSQLMEDGQYGSSNFSVI